MTTHAGFAYLAGDRLLLLKRQDGLWDVACDTRQHADASPLCAAQRASMAQLGPTPQSTVLWSITLPHADTNTDADLTLYAARVNAPFTPQLSPNHVGYGWFTAEHLPHPRAFGVDAVIERASTDLIGLCKAIADGRFASPERFYNVTLFAMRITGTGWAYRNSDDGEYTLRKRDIWTDPHVLESCQGLPVVLNHPDSAITDDRYFAEHIIGTIIYPFVRDHEVWGIARIQDRGIARALTEEHWSTSPGLVTTSPGAQRALPNGTRVTVEGPPSHLDHLAIVPEGVWDKYHAPSGIDTPMIDRPPRPDAPKARGFSLLYGDTPPMARTLHDATDPHDPRPSDSLSDRLSRVLEEVNALTSELRHSPQKDLRCDELSDGDGDDSTTSDARRDRVTPEKTDQDHAMIERMVAQMRHAGAKEGTIIACLHDMGAAPEHFGFESKDTQDADDRAIRERLDALNRRNDAHEAEMEKLRRRARPLSDDDHNEISEAEAKADSVTQPLGLQTPRYIPGETVSGYRRRLASSLQKHSSEWGKTRLSDLDDAVFEIAEKQIYADARAAASRPVASAPNAPLRKISTRSPSGHTRTEYRGGFRSAFGAFMA